MEIGGDLESHAVSLTRKYSESLSGFTWNDPTGNDWLHFALPPASKIALNVISTLLV